MPNTTTKKQRLNKRNAAIKMLYAELQIKHHQWRNDAIIKKVADTFFLAPRTIEAILRGEGNY